MNILVLLIVVIYLHVHYICGIPCIPGMEKLSRRFLANQTKQNSSSETLMIDAEPRSNFKLPKEVPKVKDASFNPLKHRSWKLIFDDDCGMSAANRIIGGIDADLGQYPWIARIGYVPKNDLNKEPVFQCGGTLISHYYVVTAAHCVANLPDNMLISVIRLGEHQTNTTIDCVGDICAAEVVDIKPQNIFVHKNYSDPQNGYDIAIIRLLDIVNITEWVSPICLPYGHVLKKNYTNETAEVAGWGVYELGLSNGSTTLQTVKLPLLNFTTCLDIYKTANLSEEDQMCVGGEVGKDSCNGDSGGPLMKVLAVNGIPRYYLLGVVSFGSKYCGMSTTPAIYTRITAFVEWILSNVRNYK